MPRNIRWDESVQKNVLNLVEALLYQADDELDDLALKAAVHVEWVTANKLRVTGKEKQTRRKREQVIEVGTRKEHLVKLVNKTGKSLKLPQRKKESGSSQPERELAEVQTALDCLRELGVFEEEKNTRKNQGYWKFTLTLKHQTATREENLEVVRQKWKEHPKTNSLVTSSTTPILETEKSIDWRDVCLAMLEKQKQLTTNRLMRADEMLFDIDRIRVDLALVERKQPDKRSGDDNPEQSQSYKPDYEETQKLEYKDFLTKVLKSEQSQKVAIIGEPGAGKTTLLQRIAFWILDKTDDLPIWIPLGNFPNPAPKFKDYLLNDWLEDAIPSVTPKVKAEFEELLTAGKVWLLLDGVDEMAAKSGSPLTVIANRIVGWCDRLRVVLTCRLNVWEANPYSLNGFQTYRTLEFSQEKVEEFIKACFQKSDPELGIQLQQALNQPGKERIKDLVRNPLRLMLLCSTWHLREGKLPDTKAELYQQFVEEVYRWQDKEKEVSTITPEEREQLNAKLQELAVAAIDNEKNRFCLRQKFVEGVFGESSLFQLALEVGWLNQVGVDAKNPNQRVYAFYHPTFQEYFAALAIADWDFFLPRAHDNDNPKPVSERYRIFEPQWKEVILLWLGRPYEEVAKEQKEKFIKKLVEFEDGCGKFYRTIPRYVVFSYLCSIHLNSIDIDQFINDFLDCSLRETLHAFHKLSFREAARMFSPSFLFFTFRSTSYKWNKFYYLMPELYGIERYQNRVLLNSKFFILSNMSRSNYIKKLLEYLSDKDMGACIEKYMSLDFDEEIDTEMMISEEVIEKAITIRGEAIIKLLEITYSDPTPVIAALSEALYASKDEHTRRLFAWILGKITPGNLEAFNVLIYLLGTSHDDLTRFASVDSLAKIIQEGNLLCTMVKCLKDCLTEYVYKNDPQLYNDYHLFLRYCAENVTYPAFYQAWHQQEVVEKTTTSDSQSLNQADLPQSLQSAIANDPQLSQIIHLICIDRSQFIDPDRPAAEIYDQMLDQNCPECHPVPETMPALKLYWNSLKRNSYKRPVLVFYASSTDPYSEAFLTDLSKFGGAICCVVTSPPTPLLRGEGSKTSSGSPSSSQGEGARGWGSLQLFAPTQAIADVVQWIRVMVLEE